MAAFNRPDRTPFMPRSKTRRPAAAARAPQRRAPDAIDEATRTFRGVIAAVTLAKQALKLPWDSPRAARMRALSEAMLQALAAKHAAPPDAADPAPADPAGPRR